MGYKRHSDSHWAIDSRKKTTDNAWTREGKKYNLKILSKTNPFETGGADRTTEM